MRATHLTKKSFSKENLSEKYFLAVNTEQRIAFLYKFSWNSSKNCPVFVSSVNLETGWETFLGSIFPAEGAYPPAYVPSKKSPICSQDPENKVFKYCFGLDSELPSHVECFFLQNLRESEEVFKSFSEPTLNDWEEDLYEDLHAQADDEEFQRQEEEIYLQSLAGF